MGKDSKIEWTDNTFNPWMGCTKVSPGCSHCYAETLMDKRWNKVDWGPQGARQRTGKSYWLQPYKWNDAAKERGVRENVFCASLADVFEEKLDQKLEMNQWRAELFAMIVETPWLNWQLLTKRPENVCRMVEEATGFSDAEMWFHSAQNAWIGTSIENQETADKRVPILTKIPASIRFLSVEPLIAPVNMWIWSSVDLEWVIAGGESGSDARIMHIDWVREIRDWCIESTVPFFFKQWGEWVPHTGYRGSKTGMKRVGKKEAGRTLDGVQWNQMPFRKI